MRKTLVIALLLCPSLVFAEPSPAKRALIDELLGFSAVNEPTAVDVYDRHFTEAQLRELIAFFRSDLGKRYLNAQTDLLSGAIARSKAKRTMADLRTLAVCAEAYATDYNAYPQAKSIDELQPILQPTYVRNMPKLDGWGNPYRYVTNETKDAYCFVSGGPDGKVDPANLKIGAPASKSSDDLVFENGEFVQAPSIQ